MKRFLTTLVIIYTFLFGFGSISRASDTSEATVVKGKWGALNSLKNVLSPLMSNGHIVRLEFKNPVSQWMKPVFDKQLVEIDFPGAFVGTANKSFSFESPIISNVFANQFDRETLRISFQIKPSLKDIKERIKLLQQGRFVLIRFDAVNADTSFIFSSKGSSSHPVSSSQEGFCIGNEPNPKFSSKPKILTILLENVFALKPEYTPPSNARIACFALEELNGSDQRSNRSRFN